MINNTGSQRYLSLFHHTPFSQLPYLQLSAPSPTHTVYPLTTIKLIENLTGNDLDFPFSSIYSKIYAFCGFSHWVVPENIRTPTTGGIEILSPPHAFGNSKMLYLPTHSEFQTPLPHLSFGIPEVFLTPSEFLIQSTNPPRIFFRPLKKMRCILNLNS